MKKIALATILSYTTILSACDRDCKTEQIEKIGGQSESKSEVASEPRVNNIVDEKNINIFNHNWLKKDAVMNGQCMANDCSLYKVIDFKILNKDENSSMLELTLLYGNKDDDTGKVVWRENSYKEYILCSITSPTMISGGGVFVLPLNSKEGFTDANINDGILYGQICHNERQYNLVEKYKYNVKGYDTFNNSTPDFFGGLDVQ